MAEQTQNNVKPKTQAATKSSPAKVVAKKGEKAKTKTEGKPKDKPKKEKKRKERPAPWWKDILLGVVNAAFIISTIFFLEKLPDRAGEFRKVRTKEIDSSAKSSIEIAGLELESSKDQVQELKNLYPDEEGLLAFVKEIDILKEEGVVITFSFASENVVQDRTGYFGIPFVIEFQGTWGQVGEALSKLQKLPFMFRAVSVETERVEGESLISFRYGGFLYVDESLKEN
ncbi:MAG: hypothetical protein ACC618_02380 [Patescibacteria group bacterium]